MKVLFLVFFDNGNLGQLASTENLVRWLEREKLREDLYIRTHNQPLRMPIELKVSISLFIVGITNVFLRNNRNWIFGYRSPRAIKSHKSYAYANLIYGVGMTLISAAYLLMIFLFTDTFERWNHSQHGTFALIYFGALFVIIEIKLRQVFRGE